MGGCCATVFAFGRSSKVQVSVRALFSGPPCVIQLLDVVMLVYVKFSMLPRLEADGPHQSFVLQEAGSRMAKQLQAPSHL